MLKTKIYLGWMFLLILQMSCKKDEAFDIQGEEAVKFYTNNESPGNAPKNSLNYSAVNIPNTAGSGIVNLSTTTPATIRFPVFATKPVNDEVTIGAEVDNKLVAEYNKEYNTDYAVFPVSIFFNPNSLSARIPKGSTISADSIALGMDQTKLNLLTEKAYMAPIKLTTVSKTGAGEITSSNTRIAYVVVKVETRLIKFNATAAEAMGTLITPRSSWLITLTPTPTSMGGNGSIIDGSTTTYSRWGASPGQVDVNMQTSKDVTGIRLYTTNSSTLTPTMIDVYASGDGINYDLIGSPLRANLSYASSYNYILFYKAITARYLRLVLYYSTSTNTQNLRVTEFDVYAN